MKNEIEKIKGQTVESISVERHRGYGYWGERKIGDRIDFRMRTGGFESFIMEHSFQDCCEEVWIEEIIGDLCDLVGSEILEAEMEEDSKDAWTFYKFSTIKGSVFIGWGCDDNTTYSKEVDFYSREKK